MPWAMRRTTVVKPSTPRPAGRAAVVRASGGGPGRPPPAPAPPLGGRELDAEIVGFALPTLAALAADPLASLVSTAYVGALGATELAAVGVALSVYNSGTKLFNMPLLSVTTSAVASALGDGELGDPQAAARVGEAASAGILLALGVGAAEAGLLLAFGVPGLALWGAGPDSALHSGAAAFLGVRAASAPATALLLTLQGAFRGVGRAQTAFVAAAGSNALNIVLEPLLIFSLGWGVRGAALAIAVSQVAAAAWLLSQLRGVCSIRLAGPAALRSTLAYAKPTGLLALRTLCVSAVFATATSLAARTGAAGAAAHQVAFQLWLASSLLADSLAVAAQALLARFLAAGNAAAARAVAARTLALAARLGLGLALGLGVGAGTGALPRLFTSDAAVLGTLSSLMVAVVSTQPLNALAFTADGILYGVGGFRYAAQAMVLASLPAAAVMLLAAPAAAALGVPHPQLAAVWAGLAVLMALRFCTIYCPYRLGWGPLRALDAAGAAAPQKSD